MIDSNAFSLAIERIASQTNHDYMDAICHYCEEHKMEVETAAALINPKLRELITIQAANQNQLKDVQKHAVLPI